MDLITALAVGQKPASPWCKSVKLHDYKFKKIFFNVVHVHYYCWWAAKHSSSQSVGKNTAN